MDVVSGIMRPRLRQGTVITMRSAEAVIAYRSRSCRLEFPPEGQDEVGRLLQRLTEGGCSAAELAESIPDLEEQLPDILIELDQLHLLTESDAGSPPEVISGSQLYREVYRMTGRVKRRLAPSRFLELLRTSRASVRQLVGFALEYYWVVRTAPSLLGPALATATSTDERRLLADFLASELNHDRYLAESLAAVDLQPEQLEHLQPLPKTFALCASLGVYATQHPLSFKAALFLFELPQEEFIRAFERRCRELQLPEAFYGPMRQHANLNDDGEHDAISAELLDLVPVVDRENQTIVMRNVSLIVEMLIQQEHNIIDYYGNPKNPLPRVFD